jgi:hypothetical protein
MASELQTLTMYYPPIRTVGAPGPMTLPAGAGIGATQVECNVSSPSRAAGKLPIRTVAEPIAIMPGPAGTHPASMQGTVMSETLAAGILDSNTVGCPFTIASGIGGCGIGVGVGAGG